MELGRSSWVRGLEGIMDQWSLEGSWVSEAWRDHGSVELGGDSLDDSFDKSLIPCMDYFIDPTILQLAVISAVNPGHVPL